MFTSNTYPLSLLFLGCSKNSIVTLTFMSFLRQHLGASGPETADVEALKLEVTELRQKCEQLQEENTELRAKVIFLILANIFLMKYLNYIHSVTILILWDRPKALHSLAYN